MWVRINNAGSNAYKYNLLSESTDADLISIVETNVLGVMLCCKEVASTPPRLAHIHTFSFGPAEFLHMWNSGFICWKEELIVFSERLHCFCSSAF